MIKSRQVPEKEYQNRDRIWASTKNIRASTGKVIESGQVPEESWKIQEKCSNMGKYQRRVRVSSRRVVESERVPEKVLLKSRKVLEKGLGEYQKSGRIQASIGKSDDQIWACTREAKMK